MKTPGWRGRLHSYLAEKERVEFKYGRNDCALFVAGAVQAMTGENHVPAGSYTTELGGLRKMKALGFESHLDYVAKTFTKRGHPSEACEGDIAVIDTPEGPALAIIAGRFVCHLSEIVLSRTPLIGGVVLRAYGV